MAVSTSWPACVASSKNSASLSGTRKRRPIYLCRWLNATRGRALASGAASTLGRTRARTSRCVSTFSRDGDSAMPDAQLSAVDQLRADDHNVWYFLNPKDSLSKSTDRGVTWSVVNSNVGAIGWCWYLQVDSANANTIWIASAERALQVHKRRRVDFQESPSRASRRSVTHLCFDPDNSNSGWSSSTIRASTGQRTAAAASRASDADSASCQVTQSPVNKNVIWEMGINRTPDWRLGRRQGIVSFNGGSTWQTCALTATPTASTGALQT